MEDIITNDGIFKYRWCPGFKDTIFGSVGCDSCILKNDKYCPNDKCTKDGVYLAVGFNEMKKERIQKHINEKKLKSDNK